MQTQAHHTAACTFDAVDVARIAQMRRLSQAQWNLLGRYTKAQRSAIELLYTTAKRHLGTPSGNTAAKFLLCLNDRERFPLALRDLRQLDDVSFEAALSLLVMDAYKDWREVDVLLDAIICRPSGTGAEFEHWACHLGLKGACKKADLPELPREELAA